MFLNSVGCVLNFCLIPGRLRDDLTELVIKSRLCNPQIPGRILKIALDSNTAPLDDISEALLFSCQQKI
jgi:hypothetical protein